MDNARSTPSGAIVDPSSVELEQWHRFVHLLLLLVQSGRIDSADAVALVDALGSPPDVSSGRSALYEIVRRHEPDAYATASLRPA
jgi:hypothetical protein